MAAALLNLFSLLPRSSSHFLETQVRAQGVGCKIAEVAYRADQRGW